MSFQAVTARAPASVGNVAVGFDLLGHALAAPGDRVTVRRADAPGLSVRLDPASAGQLPVDPDANTASRAVAALCAALATEPALEIIVQKGIPVSAGLGGSAASAVAAVVAAGELLETGLDPASLYQYALAGEAVASGAAHGDNIGCQLLGGLVLATADRLVPIPVPDGLHAVAVHPDYRVDTREARRCLTEPFGLPTIVAQSAGLALVLSGCYDSDFERIAAGLRDVMVEPRRAGLIPGFAAVRHAALEHGALGASISGAGPTVFGWFTDARGAERAGAAMVAAFAEAGLTAQAYVSPVDAPGARIEERA